MRSYLHQLAILYIPYIVRKVVGRKFGGFALFEHLARKVWQMNRPANRLSIVSTNLDGFGLANSG